MNILTFRGRAPRRLITSITVAALLTTTGSAIVAAGDHDRAASKRPVAAHGQELKARTGTGLAVTGMSVVSSSAYVDAGNVAVAGDVLSVLTTRREYAQVTAHFSNDGGVTELDTLTGDIFLSRLAYGSTSPFLVYGLVTGAVAGTTEYYVEVSFAGATITTAPGGALKIVTGPTSIVGLERHFTGTITNKSAVQVDTAYVAVTTYDAGGVLDVSYDATTPTVIPAGGSATYDVILAYDAAVPVTRSAVTADAWSSATAYHTAWTNYFDDVGTSPYRSDIVWNADQGITTGCGAGRFCPTANVPRDQMASFLSRALGLSGAAPNAFTDDNGNIHETNINLVAREGIASGCGGTNYCPSAKVTRGQMAAFLHRAFD